MPNPEKATGPEPVTANANIAKLVVYPNPSAGPISIKSSQTIKELFVADFTGKILQKVNVSAKTENWQVDLGRYPSGTYLIQYFTEEKQWGAAVFSRLVKCFSRLGKKLFRFNFSFAQKRNNGRATKRNFKDMYTDFYINTRNQYSGSGEKSWLANR